MAQRGEVDAGGADSLQQGGARCDLDRIAIDGHFDHVRSHDRTRSACCDATANALESRMGAPPDASTSILHPRCKGASIQHPGNLPATGSAMPGPGPNTRLTVSIISSDCAHQLAMHVSTDAGRQQKRQQRRTNRAEARRGDKGSQG